MLEPTEDLAAKFYVDNFADEDPLAHKLLNDIRLAENNLNRESAHVKHLHNGLYSALCKK